VEGLPLASLTLPSPSIGMRVSIYNICDINHAYVVYLKHIKEFLTSAPTGASDERIGQAICLKTKALPSTREWKLEHVSWSSATTSPTLTTSLLHLLWLHQRHRWRLNYENKVSRDEGHTKK
jgi:hypothetical protein